MSPLAAVYLYGGLIVCLFSSIFFFSTCGLLFNGALVQVTIEGEG